MFRTGIAMRPCSARATPPLVAMSASAVPDVGPAALVLAQKASDWSRLKTLVLADHQTSLYNLGLNAFFEWFGQERRLGYTKATVSAWRTGTEMCLIDDLSH
jgi:hypothetical protein